MRKTLYLQVSQDEYEFPEIVCDSVDQLSRMTGVSKLTIATHITRVKKGRVKRPRYRAVQYNDWESDEDW